jgi:large subunit ribosomal protein L15
MVAKQSAEAPRKGDAKAKTPKAKADGPKKPKSSDGSVNLSNLSPSPGSHRTRKRLGRGIGSGLGKTSGRGHKGQRARKSGNVRTGFEGGQMKLYMRLPKRGFNNVYRTEYNVINTDQLEKLFPAGAKVDTKALDDKGLIRYSNRPVKLLGRGALTKKMDVTVARASASAKAAVEKAGGSVKIAD